MATTHRVFVYGTLMRGEFHHDCLREAVFEAEGETGPRYSLVWMEYYPALLAGGSVRVRGEVYQVDDRVLHVLDELEEHPHVYERTLDTLNDGSEAFLYVMRSELAKGTEPIASGDFRDVPPPKRRP